MHKDRACIKNHSKVVISLFHTSCFDNLFQHILKKSKRGKKMFLKKRASFVWPNSKLQFASRVDKSKSVELL